MTDMIIDDGYRKHVLERLRANIKAIRNIAEDSLEGESLIGIYAVGDVIQAGSFDESSEVELLFHIDGDGEMDPYLSDQLQIDLELNPVSDLESIKAIVWRGPIEEDTVRLY